MVISTFSDRLLCQLAQIKAAQPPWRARRGLHPSRSRRKASLLIELRLGTHQAGGAAAVYFTRVWAGKHELCDWLEVLFWWSLKGPTKFTLTHKLFVWKPHRSPENCTFSPVFSTSCKKCRVFIASCWFPRVEAPQTASRRKLFWE